VVHTGEQRDPSSCLDAALDRTLRNAAPQGLHSRHESVLLSGKICDALVN
jgi:hypothetical protein